MMTMFSPLGIESDFNVIVIYSNFYLQSFYFIADFYKGIDIVVKIQTFFLRFFSVKKQIRKVNKMSFRSSKR